MSLLIALLIAWTASAASAENIYRCGNIYTQAPCPGGKIIEEKISILGDPSTPSRRTIYLCDRAGRLFWSGNHCHQHNAYLARTESVPTQMEWEDQVRQASSQWEQARQLSAPPIHTTNHSAQKNTSHTNKATSCANLEEYIHRLDSMGRAGSQHYSLDWIRNERRTTRDMQFRLKC